MKLNKKVLLYIGASIFCVLMVSVSLARAQSQADWAEDKARLMTLRSEGLTDEERCDVTWDILWTWAKKGELQAREWLFYLLLPRSFHSHSLLLPNRSGDYITQIRDGVIMAIHSIGVRHEDERYTDEFYDEISYWLLKLSFDELRLSKFFTCMNETRSDNCVQIVVDEGIVPSFDAYAIEIDALLGHGMKPVCIFHKGPIFNNLEEENIENE